MAGASHPSSDGEKFFNRAQLKLNLNLPSIDPPPHSLTELQSIAQEILRQKNDLLCQLKYEDKDRHSYFTQLEHLARQIRELPLPTDSPSLEFELERKRLELETQRMQDTMLKTLGPASEVVRRREERILHLRKLDQKLAEINSLIAQHIGNNEAAAAGESAATSRRDWSNDKDIWMSNSSLDLQLAEDKQYSDTASVMSFTSSIHSSHGPSGSSTALNGQSSKASMGPKVEVVYNLLTMLFSHDRHNVSQKLLAMSNNPDTRNTLHQVGCVPLLVQLIYNQDGGGDAGQQQQQDRSNHWILSEADKETRASAAQALHNLVYNNSDDRKVKREMRILKLLEFIRDYADQLRDAITNRLADQEEFDHRLPLVEEDDMDNHPSGVVTILMKLSFDDDHRQAMSQLGALQGLSELLHLDQLAHGSLCDDAQCTTLRRYASMTLTNLTFGHGPNKSLLCSTRPLLTVLSHQLDSPNEDLRQVTASVLRNLSWRADSLSKDALQQSNIVRSLITVAMETQRESTLKSMLSALWNLSSHSNGNKAAICSVPGSLEFLVRTLAYKSESKTLSIVESGGGTLRNISSHITGRDDYRATLRNHGCFQILLHHLRSPSLTVVSNACGTLWNLSARCKEDQAALRDLGAIQLLRNLVHSRHKMIATASSAALKNLDCGGAGTVACMSPLSSTGNSSLQARKQKALEQEIDQTLTEMCDNIDPLSPLDDHGPLGSGGPFDRRMYRSLGGHNASQYGRNFRPKIGNGSSTPNRQARSSSLERKTNGIGPPVPAPSSRGAVAPRLQTTRTAWHSHENETSYTSLNYEEEDEPVNYSLKYTEEVGSVPAAAARWTPSRNQASANDPANGNTKKSTDAAGSDELQEDAMGPGTVKKALVLSVAYRETDLDEPEHPTNFSLRYQEDDEDYTADSDTMQTYCMEGTPYETPFTRSSAASLTDLREAGLLDEKEVVSTSRKTEIQQNSSGATEAKAENKEEDDSVGKTPPPRSPIQNRPPQSSSSQSAKTVTFNTSNTSVPASVADCENNYAEQTPLMFSRSSSLESLDSLDQQQAHDEGSVVSEFSRLTSRAVSPSELPDSPGQTMPSSPRRSHPQVKQQQQQQQQEMRKPFPLPQPQVRHHQPMDGVFEDATNNFGQEGTPAFTRAASPLSQLSFDDEPSSPTPPPPPVAPSSRPPMQLPPSVRPNPSSSLSQEPAGPGRNNMDHLRAAHPALGRVIKSTSEVNFRSAFDYDEARNFNEEDSPALTRCTSLSSLHIDGEVISTAKMLPPSQAMGNLAVAHLGTERKVEAVNVVVVESQQSTAAEASAVHSANWSEEESGSDDDLLLEDIIRVGMPSSRQPPPKAESSAAPPPPPARTSSTFNSVIPKSASAHSLSGNSRADYHHQSSTIPSSQSVQSHLSKGAAAAAAAEARRPSDSEDDDDDDDEMLYACIKAAKPTVKPLSVPKTSSSTTVKPTSSAPPPVVSNGIQRNRPPARPPMELPKPPATKERVPPLHGPFNNIRQMAVRSTKSTTDVITAAAGGARSSSSSNRVRSRHSSQGSSRLGASGCSNNTSVDLDYRYSYKVEDTPVTFSRNSSLSSLSVNSNDDEPSAEDQALLDSCISWGMPKSKSDGLSPRKESASKSVKSKTAKTSTSSSSLSKGGGASQLPSSQSWGGGVRRAGDGQASSSSAPTAAILPQTPTQIVDPSDVVIKMDEQPGDSMTHSSLIRIEANQIASQIQQLEVSASQPQSLLTDVDQQSSLLSPSFIDLHDGAGSSSSWIGPEANRKSPSVTRKSAVQSEVPPLLKQVLTSGFIIGPQDGSVMDESCSSSRIELTRPPPEVQQHESLTSLQCSVLDPSYFDDEQRREGLLSQLALMEQTVDENANTDNKSVCSTSPTEKRKLTPRDRRQMDKDRYQTYTLNANSVEDDSTTTTTPPPEDADKRALKQQQRRSDERFKTQTIVWPAIGHGGGGLAADEKMMKSISASELTTLEMDAKAVIRNLKEGAKLSRKNSNSSEFNSETWDLLDCETLSLVSNESESDRSLCSRVRKLSLQRDGCGSNESLGDVRRTRITRPEDKSNLLEDPAGIKGIRGRRRVLYPVRVAPVSNNRPAVQQQQTQVPSITPPKTTAVVRTSSQSRGRSASPASPSPVRPNRTSALRQTTATQQTQKSKTAPMESLQVRLRPNMKSPRISSAPCSPRQPPQPEESTIQQLKRRSLEVTAKMSQQSGPSNKSSPTGSESVTPAVDPHHPPLATLGKQGTFTKEKPSEPVKKEEEAAKVPPKVPPKPKLPASASKPALPKKPTRFNNNGGGGSGPSPLSSPRSKGSPALSRRSVSSVSIGSDSTVATNCSTGADEMSAATPPLKRTPPKKVVTSKISQLWKQVEESRSKEKTSQPDARKWISRAVGDKPSTEDKAVGSSPEAAAPSRPIVSSGTFEKLSSFTNGPLPVITDKKSPPSRLPFRLPLPRFGRSASSSASTTPVTPTLPTPPSPNSSESSCAEAEDKRKFRVTAL